MNVVCGGLKERKLEMEQVKTLLGRRDKGRSETFTYKMHKEEGMQAAVGRREDV